MILQKIKNQMILKGIQRSICLLSFARPPSRVLLMDDNFSQTDYDVSDISKDDFSGVISQRLGKKNLASLSSDEEEFKNIRNGIVFGDYRRGIISLPTRFQNKQPVWIHYLIATGSPWTFLSIESITALIDSKKISNQSFTMKINGLGLDVRISKANFQHINLLGMDYLKNVNYAIDGKKQVVSIQFDGKLDKS